MVPVTESPELDAETPPPSSMENGTGATVIEEVPIISEIDAGSSQSVEQPKRGRGRPKKEASSKPKPKPKPKAQRQEEDTYEYDAPQQPPELDRAALAGEVLALLQHEHRGRRQAKRTHYAQWFNQMF